MMLTACCCIWYEEDAHFEKLMDRTDNAIINSPTVHTSITHTYLSLVDSMIRRADEKCDLRDILKHETHLSVCANTPKVLSKFSYIQSFVRVLLPLCRLAYNDLVSDDTKLVFQRDELEEELGLPLVQMALTVGLISQAKAPGRFHQQNVSISFYHKTIQEFMAAIYLTCTDTDDIRSHCTFLVEVMEVANIIMFIIALDSSFCCSIYTHVQGIIDTDTEIQDYRHTFQTFLVRGKVRQLFEVQCRWHKEVTHCHALAGYSSSPSILQVSDIYLYAGSDSDMVRLVEELMVRNIKNIVSVCLTHVRFSLSQILQFLPQCNYLSGLYTSYMCTFHEENQSQLVEVIPQLTQLKTIQYVGHGRNFSASDTAVVMAILQLTQLSRLVLRMVHLADGNLVVSSDMTKLEAIELSSVTMPARSWYRFTTSLLTIRRDVRVTLGWKTNLDYNTHSSIYKSPYFTVIKQDRSRDKDGWFEFKTKHSLLKNALDKLHYNYVNRSLTYLDLIIKLAYQAKILTPPPLDNMVFQEIHVSERFSNIHRFFYVIFPFCWLAKIHLFVDETAFIDQKIRVG